MDLPVEAAEAPPVEAAVTPAEVAVAPSAVVAVAPPAAVAVATPAVGAEALLAAGAEAARVAPRLPLSRSEGAARGAVRGDPTGEEVLAEARPVAAMTDPRLAARLVTTRGVATGRVVAGVQSTVASAPR